MGDRQSKHSEPGTDAATPMKKIGTKLQEDMDTFKLSLAAGLELSQHGRRAGKRGKKLGGQGMARFVSHLVVGPEESLSGAFIFVLPSLLLYIDRAAAVAEPLLSKATDWAVNELLGGFDEVVVYLSLSINNPTLRGGDKVEPCRNNWQTSLY